MREIAVFAKKNVSLLLLSQTFYRENCIFLVKKAVLHSKWEKLLPLQKNVSLLLLSQTFSRENCIFLVKNAVLHSKWEKLLPLQNNAFLLKMSQNFYMANCFFSDKNAVSHSKMQLETIIFVLIFQDSKTVSKYEIRPEFWPVCYEKVLTQLYHL